MTFCNEFMEILCQSRTHAYSCVHSRFSSRILRFYGCRFVIAEDGLIFEGVGWHRIGSHTLGYDTETIGVAFIGKFAGELYKFTVSIAPTWKNLQGLVETLNSSEAAEY